MLTSGTSTQSSSPCCPQEGCGERRVTRNTLQYPLDTHNEEEGGEAEVAPLVLPVHAEGAQDGG